MLSAAKKHGEVLSQQVLKVNGEIQNMMDDGSLCLFDTATDAMTCAREIQLRLPKDVPVRIGIYHGEVTLEDGKTYGDGVNITSRIESSGHQGTILFSRSLNDKIRNDPSLLTESVGFFRFKNVEKPMELYTLKSPIIETST